MLDHICTPLPPLPMALVMDKLIFFMYLHSTLQSFSHVFFNNRIFVQGTEIILKVCDFGISREEASTMTIDKGTSKYQAPEVIMVSNFHTLGTKCIVTALEICNKQQCTLIYKSVINYFETESCVRGRTALEEKGDCLTDSNLIQSQYSKLI
jgi:serine/threonine protein kinase